MAANSRHALCRAGPQQSRDARRVTAGRVAFPLECLTKRQKLRTLIQQHNMSQSAKLKIELSPEDSQYASEQVEAGKYKDVSEAGPCGFPNATDA